MKHIFDVEIAKVVGVNAAVILEHFQFWIAKNRADGTNQHDGKTWTYSSVKALSELLPYLTQEQIRGAISKLKTAGYIETGNYNKNPYDRTQWYSLVEMANTTSKKTNLDFVILPNGKSENPKPIPDKRTDRSIVKSKEYKEKNKTPEGTPAADAADIFGEQAKEAQEEPEIIGWDDFGPIYAKDQKTAPEAAKTQKNGIREEYTFEAFWSEYGKKVGKKKAEARFSKLSAKEREAIKAALPAYIAATPDRQYRKNPETYLNGRCWEDEIITKETEDNTGSSYGRYVPRH